MLSIQARMRVPAMVSAVLLAMIVGAPAQAEAADPQPGRRGCRNEARAKVFSAPNPQGLELEEIGRQIYFACMARTNQAEPKRRSASIAATGGAEAPPATCAQASQRGADADAQLVAQGFVAALGVQSPTSAAAGG